MPHPRLLAVLIAVFAIVLSLAGCVKESSDDKVLIKGNRTGCGACAATDKDCSACPGDTCPSDTCPADGCCLDDKQAKDTAKVELKTLQHKPLLEALKSHK